MFFRKPDRGTLRDIWLAVHRNHNVTTANLTRMEKILMALVDDVKAAVDALNASMSVLDGDIAAVAAAYEKLKSDPANADAKAAVDAAMAALAATKAKADADHANLSSLAAQSS